MELYRSKWQCEIPNPQEPVTEDLPAFLTQTSPTSQTKADGHGSGEEKLPGSGAGWGLATETTGQTVLEGAHTVCFKGGSTN